MADFVDQKRKEMEARLVELRPSVDEFHRLEAAVAALQSVAGPAAAKPGQTRRGAATRRRKAPAKPGRGKRGRPKGSGQRGKQALELVKSRPGITIPEIADAMGIKQNYLYRVMPALEKDGLVKKQGRGWHAKDAA